jgi:TonB-linked SusC/RagA family outer membrane protein
MRHVRLLIAFMLLHSAVLAQNRQVSGAVKDKVGTGIPSVTVKVKGKNIQTVTDISGAFSLQVPAGNIQLVASSVGYGETTIDVPASQSNVAITMEESGQQLGEVVVTALGISKESRKVGYSVSTVQGDQLTQARESNVAASLSGRVAGLKVSGTNGGPGGTVKLLLRGLPSMNNPGSPLFVINGVPMDNTQRGATSQWGGSDNGDGIGNINPDDIETMTVLKGQAASALYGSRASNGVILITTKSGKKNDFSVDYNLNVMVDRAIDYTEFQYEYGQGVGGLKPATPAAAQASGRLSWGARLDGSQVIQFDGNTYPYSAQKDNIKNFYRSGPSFTNTVAVSRGGENGSFRLSLSNLNNSSIVRSSGIERKTGNLNIDQNITDKLSVKLVANYIDEKSTNRPQLSDGPNNANNGLFLATNIDENILKPGYDPATGYEAQFSDDEFVTNPWFVVNRYINNLDRKRLITSIAPRYQFSKWLYAQARLGYDITHDRLYRVEAWGTAYTTNRAGSLQDLASTERFELNVDGLIGATHKLTDDINLDAAIGANLRINQEELIKIGGGPFILPYQYSWNNVQNFNRNYTFYKTEVHSAYYTLDLAYKNFLTIGTTGRYDAYSTLPKDNNNIFVPSVSASLIFSELTKLPKLDFGKIRASYAVTSNELSKAYQTQVYYSLGNNYNNVPIGQFNTSLPSGLLKPFTVAEFEVGTELRLLGSRLNIDVAWFTKKTKNEIMGATYSIATGYLSGYIANGQTQNKGLELQVSATPVKNKDFSWTVTFNLTSVKNKVLKTDAAGNPVSLGQARGTLGNAVTAYVKGYSGPQILAYDYKRDSKGELVVDASGYPLRRDTLLAYGSVLPTQYGGLNNELTYKGVTLAFLIDYNYGNKIISATNYTAIYRGLHEMTLEGRSDGITKGVTEAGGANTVKADAQGYFQAVAQRITNTSVVDGDFIKLRQVTLGYSIPSEIVNKSVIFRSATISLVGRNLWTIMRNSDNIDPESQFGNTINFIGIEGTSLPSTRTYGVNLNLKFKK